MAKKEEIYPDGYPRQTESFSEAQKFKFDVYEAIKEIALKTIEKAFEDKGYSKKEGRAGEYGNGESYGAGTSLNHFNIRLTSRPNTNTYFEKIIYFGGKENISEVSIGWDAKNKAIEMAYKTSEVGAFRGYGSKVGAHLINDRTSFVVKSLPTFKKELEKILKIYAEKEVAHITSTKIGIEDKTEKSINSMVETSMKKFSLKNLMTSSDEDLSSAVDRYISENKKDTPVNELTKAYANRMLDKTMSGRDNVDSKIDPIVKNRLSMGIKKLSSYVNPEIKSYVESLGGEVPDSSTSDKVILSFPDHRAEGDGSRLGTTPRVYIHIYQDKATILNGKIEDLSERIQTLLPKIIKKIQADFGGQVNEGKKNDKETKARMNSPEVVAANSKGKLLFDDLNEIEEGEYKEYFKDRMKKFGAKSPNELKSSEWAEINFGWKSKEEKNLSEISSVGYAAVGPIGGEAIDGTTGTVGNFKYAANPFKKESGVMKKKFEKTNYSKGQKKRASSKNTYKSGDPYSYSVDLVPGSGYVPKGMDKNYVMGQHTKNIKESMENTNNKSEDSKILKESLVKRKFTSLTENEEKGVNKRYIVTEQRSQDEQKDRWKKLSLFETYETINKKDQIHECGCGCGCQNDVSDENYVTMEQGEEENEAEFMQRNQDVESGEFVDGKEVVVVAKPNSLSNALYKVFKNDYMNENKAYILDLTSGNLVNNPNFKPEKRIGDPNFKIKK